MAEQAWAGPEMVRADSIRGFDRLVGTLGGDSDALLHAVGLEPDILTAGLDGRFAHRALIDLLEIAAERLDCPDFGMRLAALQTNGARPGGPLEIAMRHSRTIGDALRYSADHIRAYTNDTHILMQRLPDGESLFVRFDILLRGIDRQGQSVENALLAMAGNIAAISGGRVRPREVWFSHERVAPAAAYRAHFGCAAQFDRADNGLVFAAGDLDIAIPGADPRVYDAANSSIRRRIPTREPLLSARARRVVERQMLAGECSFAGLAEALGLHPRTLQRRLKAEGLSFEGIRDEVRREVALQYLRRTELPFGRLAEMLGYSEASVLSRSCNRWFRATPRQLRLGIEKEKRERA